jgi:hypothetical protein
LSVETTVQASGHQEFLQFLLGLTSAGNNSHKLSVSRHQILRANNK